MNAQASLFGETRDALIQRLDREIESLLFGRPGGPLQLKLSQDEAHVLQMIRFHRGSQNAVSLRVIQDRTKLDVRTIKGIVRTLRMSYRLPIGSSKHSGTGGYYLMLTDEDRAVWRKDVIDQVRAQLDVLHAADGQQAALEALGQLRAEILSGATESEADHG